MRLFNWILTSILGGYLGYIFVLATINTFCDCI
jgi:hypothetical protein